MDEVDYALGLEEEEDIDDTPTTRSDQGGRARGNGMVGKRVEGVVTRSGRVVCPAVNGVPGMVE